jgi:hypothetical protein
VTDFNIKDEWGGIDEKIKPLVLELNRLGFPTSSSCEGHVDHGFPGPWISVYPDETRIKAESLLAEFYSSRNSDPDIKISITPGNGSFWIYSGGERFINSKKEINSYAERKAAGENPTPIIISVDEKSFRKKILPIQQQEISDFVIFLKSQTIL